MPQPRPSVGELIEFTSIDSATSHENALRWMESLDALTRSNILSLLFDYHQVENQTNKITIYQTLASHAFHNTGLSAGEHMKKMTTEASYIKDRVKRLEKVIADPEDVVLRRDRSVVLGNASCVLPTGQIEFLEFAISLEKNKGQSISFEDDREVNLFPILNGNYSAKKVQDGELARWLVGKDAALAQIQMWCADLAEEPVELRSQSTQKDKLMRLFNMYIDLLEDGNISDKLATDSDIQAIIRKYNDTIYVELLNQVKKQAESGALGRIESYRYAMQQLDKPELSDEMICDFVTEDTPDEEVTTSLLYEAA